ncbi:MAG: tetratricopeptide repeat protein [Gemmatimonadales bacterium]
MLRLRTLGSPSVEGSAGPLSGAAAQRKSLALLALLACAGERGVSRDKILAYLWPETEAPKAAHRLSQVLHALRRDLEAEALFLGTSELRLNPQVISTDTVEFTDALDRGDLERAVSLYGGPFLDGFYLTGAVEFERWVEVERAQYAKHWSAALESLASGAARRSDWRRAADWWRPLAENDPLNSRIAVCFIEALSAGGDRAGALQVAQLHEKLLREELDAAPDPAVLAAVERIRTRPADLPASSPPARAPEPGAPVAAIAVLPFVNLSSDREDEYFSDGMTDELMNALAHVEELRVASRTSCFAFKGKSADVREIGDRLKVGAVVEGSVRKAGNQVRITAELVSVADGYQLWSETYQRTLADVFAVQEELARAIVSALSLKVPEKIGRPLVKPSTEVLEAYTLYLRGRYCANKRTAEGLRAATEYFNRAIERDPRYALAHAGLAESYVLRGFEEFSLDLRPAEAMPKAKAAALQALEIEPTLADAHGWLGAVAMLYDWDWPAAERHFQRALTLNPSAILALLWYAVFLGARGQHDESMRLAKRAETLDPGSLTAHLVVARCYYWARRYDEAIEQLRAVLEMEPNHALTYVWLARAYNAKGLFGKALAEGEKGMRLVGRLPILLMICGHTYGRLGRREESQGILEELRNHGRRCYVPAVYEASILAGLGDNDAALRLYELASEQRAGSLAWFLIDAFWEPLTADPRFGVLRKKMGFEL